ncbi:MAG: nucleotidyl transferase AbiEii/AbiGii toxin family protein [Patescibacteria group bacterium]
MEQIKPILKNLIAKSITKNNLYKRNLLKEYLQILVLDFIYANPKYNNLIFYGGSCLAHCYDLPRLSEDLDFIDIKKQYKIEQLASDLRKYFQDNTDLKIKTTVQKFRIYLKFPILWELKIARKPESNLLFLKIEIYSKFDFCKKYEIDVVPLFKFNHSILARTFDLPTLMATKLRAIFLRKWEKVDKKGKTFVKVKGRDYFDLMWYLQKRINPNLNCIEMVKNKQNLKNNLLENIAKIDPQSIYLDLEALIEDKNFVKNLSKNIKKILKNSIEKNLS